MNYSATERRSDDSDRICVAVRVRPLGGSELLLGRGGLLTVCGDTLSMTTTGNKINNRTDSSNVRIKSELTDQASHNNNLNNNFNKMATKTQAQRIRFRYDSVFDTSACNAQVYDGLARSVVQSVMRPTDRGFSKRACVHGLVLAYGQTSSGKTHTMDGNELDLGIIPRAIADVFADNNAIHSDCNNDGTEVDINADRYRPPVVHVSYVEVYNDRVKDLIRPSGAEVVLRDVGSAVFSSASRTRVQNASDALALLKQGAAVRAVGDTPMNVRSSRSHTVFTLHIRHRRFESGCERNGVFEQGADFAHNSDDERRFESTLQLVDLAGSERVRHTNATGSRLREGGHINQSLLVLSTIVSRLSAYATKTVQQRNTQQVGHLPFRDSKLTRLLRPALQPGSGARVAILATVTPSPLYADETFSTLQFASRAKNIPLIPGSAYVGSTSDLHTRKKNSEQVREYQQRYTQLSQEFDAFRETFAKLQEELTQLRQEKSDANSYALRPEHGPYRAAHSSVSGNCSDAEPTDSGTLVTTSLSAPSTCVSPLHSCTSATTTTMTTTSSSCSTSSTSPMASSSSSEEDIESSRSVTDSSCAPRNLSKKASAREKTLTAHVAELEAENEHLRDRLRTMVADVCRQRLRSAMLHSLARSRSRRTSLENNICANPGRPQDRLNAGFSNDARNMSNYATFTRQQSGTSGMGPRMMALATGCVGQASVYGAPSHSVGSGSVHDGRNNVPGRSVSNIEKGNSNRAKHVREPWRRDMSELLQDGSAALAIVPSQPAGTDTAELVPYFTRVLDSAANTAGPTSHNQNSWLTDAAQNVSVLLKFIVDSLANRRRQV